MSHLTAVYLASPPHVYCCRHTQPRGTCTCVAACPEPRDTREKAGWHRYTCMQRSRRRCSWQHRVTLHSSAARGHGAASLAPAPAPAPAPGRRALRPVAEAELSHEPQRGGAAQRSCHLEIWQHRINCGILRAETMQTLIFTDFIAHLHGNVLLVRLAEPRLSTGAE